MFADLFFHELQLSCRRRKFLRYRWVYGFWLVSLFAVCYSPAGVSWFGLGIMPINSPLKFGGFSFIGWTLSQRLLLLILLTPLFVAGQITDEKHRGVLQFTFLTTVEGWQIVLSKLLAQGLLLGSLLVVDLPLLLVATIFEDYSIQALVAHTVAMLVLIFAIGAAALLASVWCWTTRGVLLLISLSAVVLGFGMWGLEWSLTAVATSTSAGWAATLSKGFDTALHFVDPGHLIDVADNEVALASLTGRLGVFTLFWGGLAVGLVTLASWRLRPKYLAQLEKLGRERDATVLGPWRPPVGRDPLYWRECHLEGAAPPGLLRRVPHWAGLLATAVVTGLAAAWELKVIRPVYGGPVLLHTIFAACLLALVVGLRSCTAMVVEKQRQTFDLLMLTNWTYGEVVDSVFRGIMHAYWPYLCCYTIVALSVSAFFGWEEVFFTVVFVPLVWQVVLWVCLGGLESSRGESSMLGAMFATTIASGAALFGLAYAWMFLSMIAEQAYTAATWKAQVVATIAVLAVVLTAVSVAAPYWLARRYFLRLQWKPGRTPAYKRALKAAGQKPLLH